MNSCNFHGLAFGAGATLLLAGPALLFSPPGAISIFLVMVIDLVWAAPFVVIGIGLIKIQNWARVLVIVLAGPLSVIGALAIVKSFVHADVSELVPLVVVTAVSVLALIYLFKPQVKQAFGATRF